MTAADLKQLLSVFNYISDGYKVKFISPELGELKLVSVKGKGKQAIITLTKKDEANNGL